MLARYARYTSIHLIAHSYDDYMILSVEMMLRETQSLITDKRCVRRGARKSDNNNCE